MSALKLRNEMFFERKIIENNTGLLAFLAQGQFLIS